MGESNHEALKFLLERRSRPAKTLVAPGPDKANLEPLLTAAARTPDHGKLEPWRFIVLSKETLTTLAEKITERAKAMGLDEDQTAKARRSYDNGPMAVVVVEVQKTSVKIPAIEQTYSAGAACLALLNAALAHGWGANWLSGWPSHDREFASNAFSLAENERVAGLIYIGTETSRPPERSRPNLQNIVTWL
jgi:nitroreductase